MLFFVQNDPPHQLFKGHEVAAMLKNELRKQKADFLIFRALEINTVSKLWAAASKGPANTPTGLIPAHRVLSLMRKELFILSILTSNSPAP